MWCVKLLLFFVVLGGSWRHVRCTCVLESEFGFTLNCAFKKSGLFRVRNLGGIKAHVGLGFTVGDELGFSESLSNVEGNRRRSTQNNRFQNAVLAANAEKNNNNKLTVVQPTHSQVHHLPNNVNTTPKVFVQNVQQKGNNKMGYNVPAFKPIPPAQERPITSQTDKILKMTALNATKPIRKGNAPTPALIGIAVPAFQTIPASISRISPTQTANSDRFSKPDITLNNMNPIDKLDRNNKIINAIVPSVTTELLNESVQHTEKLVQSLPVISNISMEAIEAAIIYRQQQLMKQKNQPAFTTSTHPPTQKPTTASPKRHLSSSSKVMNAPREYYPVGYDKNFDDNFASKVELPDTSFYCGEQKHFPGLYADEDLGCMVFHVCALTDDGLIMKSFLCPESTLFDQTILKCNWWFYVDCKNSKKLYDSNIPISKSYQLMKALTFFSSYKKEQNANN